MEAKKCATEAAQQDNSNNMVLVNYTAYQENALELGYKPRTVNIDTVRATVPHELQQWRQFIVWQYQPDKGKEKPKKMPLRFNGVSFHNGASTDAKTYMSFEDALALYEEYNELDGIGFALTDNDPFTVVDLDDCVNGVIDGWAADKITKAKTWTELTPSGKGFHCVVNANVDGMKSKSQTYHNAKLEMYKHGRYFTITGNVLPEHKHYVEIADGQQFIEQLNAELLASKMPNMASNELEFSFTPSTAVNTTGYSADEVIRIIGHVAAGNGKGKTNADKFLRLHNGGFVSDDQSADDMSYMNTAAFYSGKNPEVMKELYFQSAIVREKSSREDYIQRTIDEAISKCAEVFTSNNTNMFDENGELYPTFDELLAQARAMDAETPESDIQKTVAGTKGLNSIQRRKIFDAIKRSTKLPLSVLNDALKESAPDSDAPDQLALARKVVEHVGKENIIAAQSFVWAWDDKGVWRKQEERTTRQFVHNVIPPLVDDVNKTLVEGVTDLFKTEIFSPNHEFDVGEPESVNCLNGELTLFDVTGDWILEQHCREHYRTTQIPVEYDPDATAPRFTQFMGEVFKGDPDAADKTKALLEMMGYTLMAHCRHERFIILVGSGANGKSVLLSVLEALCGSVNVAGVQPSQFDNKFQRAHLHGKLANIVTEIEQGEVIADAALKGIVSGEPTTVEHKHKDPFMMRPFATCWFGTNHMPHTRDFSDALFRRALVVSFNNVFKPELGNCDPLLKDKLLDELAGILNLALNAYAQAIQYGFTMPVSSIEARQEWRLEADQVAQFIEDECTRDDHEEVTSDDAFRQYKQWASNNGINKPVSMKSFRDRLTRLGFGSRRTNKARLVTGLKLNYSDHIKDLGYKLAKDGE